VSHPNEGLIRRLFETYRTGDRDATARFFAEDAVFRYAGPGPLHGAHRGREAIVRFWAEQDRSSGGVFMPELVDLVAGDRNVFLMVRITPQDEGPPWFRVVVYEIEKGSIAGASVFEGDPAAAEAFFSRRDATA
jgi:ketosteroid isomerase-like protein